MEHLKSFKRNNYLKSVGLSNISDSPQQIETYLESENILNYNFLSENKNFNKDWEGKTRFFTKIGRSESILHKAFSKRKLKVISQYNCSDFSYVLDFAYLEPGYQVKINIEVDEDHHFTPESRQKDRYRNYFLSKRGWGIIRFTEYQVFQAADKCAELVMYLFKTGKVHSELWYSLNSLEHSKRREIQPLGRVSQVFPFFRKLAISQ